jgi:hypothetical protein
MKHILNQTEVDIIKAFDDDSIGFNYIHAKSDVNKQLNGDKIMNRKSSKNNNQSYDNSNNFNFMLKDD